MHRVWVRAMSIVITLHTSPSVSYQTDQSVTWSVDGIAGGNSTVGTIDASGLYTAPATAGEHTITATSVADSSKSGSGTAVVYDGPVAG